MKKILSLLIVSILTVTFLPSAAFAARPVPGVDGAKTVELVGYDISYPQCGGNPPTDHYFGIVGVNGGTAATTNPCLAAQLSWAKTAKTGSKQDRVQLYVNTANPGEVINEITTWPTSNVDKSGAVTANPHGTCTGQNDRACSWQYGWNRAYEANVERFAPAAQAAGISTTAANYVWWLDVETMNTWQSGSDEALIRNTTTLEGMKSYFDTQNARVGLYSTAYQWGVITGNFVGTGSNLNGLPNWRPSGSSLKNAITNCSVAPLTAGGYISLTQYVVKGLDNNHSCI